MPDNDLRPMTDGDIETPPATTTFEPAAPLKNAGVDFEPTPDSTDTRQAERTAGAKQAIRDGAAKAQAQAGDKVRAFADQNKAKAGGALDQLVKMLTDAATQVDDKVGAQYGQYAHSAADQVQGLSDTIKNKDVDELLEDARALVRRSPTAAIGVAAALGFVVARLVQSGVDARD